MTHALPLPVNPLVRGAVAASFVLLLAVTAGQAPFGVAIVSLALLAVALLSWQDRQAGLAAFVLLFPAIGLRLVVPPFGGPLAPLFADGLDVPVPVALGLLLALVVAVDAARGKTRPAFPLGLPFLALLGGMAVSAVATVAVPQALAVKFLLYPVALAYLLNVALVATLVRDRSDLQVALQAFFWSGLAVAAMGVVSFAVVPPVDFPRATPFALFGIAPIGINHNLLAETLVAVAPVGIALAAASRGAWRQRYLVGAVLMAETALLTLARTPWLVVTLQAAALGLRQWRMLARRWGWALIVAGVLLAHLLAIGLVSRTVEVTGSTASRLSQTEVALRIFRASPLVGAGAGSYVPLIATFPEFTEHFGDPIDAHGVLQKILAENGLLGLAGWTVFWGAALLALWRATRSAARRDRDLLFAVSVSVGGSLVYQLFTTTYYTGKLWLPLGLALAAVAVLVPRKVRL